MADADDPVATQPLASPGKDKHTTASPSTSSHSLYLSRALSFPLTVARANPNRPFISRRRSPPIAAVTGPAELRGGLCPLRLLLISLLAKARQPGRLQSPESSRSSLTPAAAGMDDSGRPQPRLASLTVSSCSR